MPTIIVDMEKNRETETNLARLRSDIERCILRIDYALSGREHFGENDDVNDKILLKKLRPTITVKDLRSLRDFLLISLENTAGNL